MRWHIDWLSFVTVYLIGVSLALRLVIRFLIYRVHVGTLQGYAHDCIPVNDDSLVAKVNEIAYRLNIKKPIRLGIVPNDKQVNVVVWETDEQINIFFLNTLPLAGVTGVLAHELSHVALGHTRKRDCFAGEFISICLCLLFLVWSVMFAGASIASFRLINHLIPGVVLLLFVLNDLPKSRKRELQADCVAALTVGKEEVVAFLSEFAKVSPPNSLRGQIPLGTHPTFEQRLKKVRKLSVVHMQENPRN